ncbi:MAG: hypothetical protein ACM3W4_07600 [Ignavibacteriales bacterium]
MSQYDIEIFRRRAEALLRQAAVAGTEPERRRLIDLAAHWHACALMSARAMMAREEDRRVA